MDADTILSWVTAWLESNAERPVFLFVHLYDAHSKFGRDHALPYRAPEPFFGSYSGGETGEFTGCNAERTLCASEYLLEIFDARRRLAPQERQLLRDLIGGDSIMNIELHDATVHYAMPICDDVPSFSFWSSRIE